MKIRTLSAAIAFAAGLPLAVHAQCGGTIIDPQQGHAFVSDPAQNYVHAATRWDPDGDGPEAEWLVVVGQFTRAATQITQSVIAWDGKQWHAMDAGLPPVTGSSLADIITDVENLNGTLVAYGDGLGGNTSNVMKWNGSSWEPLGDTIVYGPPNKSLIDMEVHNSELYVAGAIGYIPVPPTGLGATPALRRVGETWQTIGPRLYGGTSRMSRLESAPEGLYGAGNFTGVGTTGSQVVLNNVALWNGTQWLPLGEGLNGPVIDTAYADGNLYVTGAFTQSGATPLPGVARWDGTQWHALGDGSQGTSSAVEAHNGELYIAARANNVTRILRLDGNAWTEVAQPGQAPVGTSTVAAVSSLVSDPEGLLILGRFAAISNFKVGGAAVIEDDGALRALGGGFDARTAMVNYNGRLIAETGQRAGDEPVNYSAQWDGREWSDAGLPVGGRLAVAGSRLLSSRSSLPTNNVTVRELQDGAWVDLGGSFQFVITGGQQIEFADFNGELYAAGNFASIDNQPIAGLARWDGNEWNQVGSGLNWSGATRADVLAGVDGNLYVAGAFDSVNGEIANGLARWDGTTLTSLYDPDIFRPIELANWNGQIIGHVILNAQASAVARWTSTGWEIVAAVPPGPTLGGGSITRLLPVGASLFALYAESPNTAHVIKLNTEGGWDQVTETVVLDLSSGARGFLADALVFNNEIHVFGDFNRQGDRVVSNWTRFSTDGVPLIVTQPSDTTVPCGEPITLSITVANGYDLDGELEYQWFRNGTALSETQFVRGVNTDTLSIPALAQPFTGFYSVTVTNSCGTATSREVLVNGDSIDCRACSPCAADFDLDGGVTGNDVAAFFASYETGNSCADVDNDGSVNGGDLDAFFTLFEAGGC